jgi:exodeoxyribonuclease X
MSALILDTETHTFNGNPVQIAYLPYPGEGPCVNRFFHPQEPMDPAAMAVHHILDADVADAPPYTTFRLPPDTTHLIGHNIDYDLQALARCGQDTSQIKAICTLAISRHLWPELTSHTLSGVLYALARDPAKAREQIRGAHDASADVQLVRALLQFIRRQTGLSDPEDLYTLSEQARVPEHMPFGKHKGLPIRELPEDYVQWLKRQSPLDPYLLQALERHRSP